MLPSGEPAHVPTLHFSHRPSTMAYCYPYLLSCGDGAELEVHATVNGRDDIVQVDLEPRCRGLCVPPSRPSSRPCCRCTQRLSLAGPAVAFADQADDAGTGRNPVYLAISTGAAAGARTLHRRG